MIQGIPSPVSLHGKERSLRLKTKARKALSNKASTAIVALLFVIGIGIMLYPMISNYLAEISQGEVISEYKDAVESLSDIQEREEREKVKEYNQSLADKVVLTDPFDTKTVEEVNEKYQNTLNIRGDGMMGYVEIPSIGVHLPIYHGTSDEVLRRGVGHLVNTSLPAGGKETHSVLSAHRGLPSARLFTDLDKVQKGEKFYLHVLGETLAYEINQIKVTGPHDTQDLLIDKEQDYATLVTCTPYGINSHRLLVRGHRVPYVEEDRDVAEALSTQSKWLREYLLALGIVVAIALIIFAVRRLKATSEK